MDVNDSNSREWPKERSILLFSHVNFPDAYDPRVVRIIMETFIHIS